MRKYFPFFLLLYFSLEAVSTNQPKVSHHQKVVPNYTGSLFSSDFSNTAPGVWITQGYFLYSYDYGNYTSKFKISKSKEGTHVINPQFLVETGITSFLDIEVIGQGFYREKNDKNSLQWGDTTLILGTPLYVNHHKPFYVRLTLNEIFPTGKVDQLDPTVDGIDQTSAGSFQTQVFLNFGSVINYFSYHPIRWRMNLAYGYAAPVKIKGTSAYGGGPNTRAKVYPGSTLLGLFSPEIVFTKNWIFTFDLSYQHTFQGSYKSSTNSNLNVKATDLVTFSPAIEYGISPKGGIILGGWFSLLGKRTTAFTSVVLSGYYAF